MPKLQDRNARRSHDTSLRVHRNYLVHRLQRKELMRAVGDLVEAVARAQHLQLVLLPDKFLHLFHRVGSVQALGAVFEIARPVFQFAI